MTALQTSTEQALRRAAGQALLAPSVHNTQPWRFRIEGNSLEIRADLSRRLPVLDPSNRQLLISCGCALFNARVALAADGFEAAVDLLPDPEESTLIARLHALPAARSEATSPIRGLDASIARRHTNRRRFADDEVASELIFDLFAAANAENAQLFDITDPEHRYAVASLSQQADAEQNADAAYRAELRRWTTDDPRRVDGVQAAAVPHVTGASHDDVPIRDFDTSGHGWLPIETQSSMRQCLLLLGAATDEPRSWIETGQALERIWLLAVRASYAVGPLTQVVETPRTRMLLRRDLNVSLYPMVLLRVGRAPSTPATPRRPLEELFEPMRGGDDSNQPKI